MCQKYPSVLIHPIINNLSSPIKKEKAGGLPLCRIPHLLVPSQAPVWSHALMSFDSLNVWLAHTLHHTFSLHPSQHSAPVRTPPPSLHASVLVRWLLSPNQFPHAEKLLMRDEKSPSSAYAQTAQNTSQRNILCHSGIWFLFTALLPSLPMSCVINV